jgi:hypothetical protein
MHWPRCRPGIAASAERSPAATAEGDLRGPMEGSDLSHWSIAERTPRDPRDVSAETSAWEAPADI